MISALKLFTEPGLVAGLEKNIRLKQIKKDDLMIKPGDDILFIPIITKGSIRILRQDNEGKEVFLYHLYPGQTCAMSLTCCQSGKRA